MVLTNFECWAHGDVSMAANFETGAGSLRPLDPFNPRDVTHIAPLASLHDADADADANNNNNNNNIVMQHLHSHPHHHPHHHPHAEGGGMTLEGRRKKRINPADAEHLMYTKRCRFDDDGDMAAQYCNDFFSLPATQVIGTQACLMDYEMQANGGIMMETQQPPSHQHHLDQQQQQQRFQQHYQGHLHRANRDVKSPMKRKARDPLDPCDIIEKVKAKSSEAEADLFIATHGGCLHHFRRLVELEESDI
ncbi:hypothetical protein KR018_004931 [Drosophila ironensis]|nr:hypothetical protein KR018_004931 [Drosophila ironensis]